MCELSRFLTGQERNQSFKFGCRLMGVVSLSEHQMFKFPDCFVVIHISLFHESVARNEKCGFAESDGPHRALSLLRLRGRNQRDGGLGGEQEESECLLQVQTDRGIVVVEVADGDVLPDV